MVNNIQQTLDLRDYRGSLHRMVGPILGILGTFETLATPVILEILEILEIRHRGPDLGMTSHQDPPYLTINLIHHALMSSLPQRLVHMELILLMPTIHPNDFLQQGPRLMRFPRVNRVHHLCTLMTRPKGNALAYRLLSIICSKRRIELDLERKVHLRLQSLTTPVQDTWTRDPAQSTMECHIMVNREACLTFKR
ncbi:hypothetical protein UCREL1_2691 [Eutypa lata UCREL1]|uniref:Uncharacterized protein n=1 Tax=Eutypa lata (strain UCR-EL1) TaxID=1287681 RepID=M7TK14_EUTLA|nr:hypothetical protein UCREL1_2691 [Eutypa lata UCREL1]